MAKFHEHYQSPYSWRYGSKEMRDIWGEKNKRIIWRRIWVTLAEVENMYGLVSRQQVDDLRANSLNIDIPRALEIEAEIHHDVMAEVRTYAEQCEIGGGVIHLGLTSMDVVDNGDALRVRDSLNRIIQQLRNLLRSFSEFLDKWADLPIIAFTHLQPAEPSTLGYRFAVYGQDLLRDLDEIERLSHDLKGKGLRGAVGTGASISELIGREQLPAFEHQVSVKLGLDFFPIVTQTYPRKQDYEIACVLAGLGASLYKFAFDLRILQSPPIGELNEPFGDKQVGSSAMPFKRNPINAEKMDSLGRLLAQYPRVAWDNAAHSLLERTLDDSANRRTTLPEAFLIADELLRVANKLIAGIVINEDAIRQNLATYGPFAAIERVLMALGKAGANRQEMHEHLRLHALKAWETIRGGKESPLQQMMKMDPILLRYLDKTAIENLMNVDDYIGDAPQRARQFSEKIRKRVSN